MNNQNTMKPGMTVYEILKKSNELKEIISELEYFNNSIMSKDTSWQNGGGQYHVNVFLKKETTVEISIIGWLLHGYTKEQKLRIPNEVLDAIYEITSKYQSDLEIQLSELLKGGK